MKNARVFFEKTGPARYISHLDLNRVMLRAIAKSGLNIWHTEGFHQHAYITFAQPLSLGFSSCCESMDFRLLNDDEDMAAVPARLNACLPDGLRVLRCAEALKQHLKSQGLELLAGDIAALERLPAPQVTLAVEIGDLVGDRGAESGKRSADGGALSQFEIVDRFVRVEQNYVETLTQSCLPLVHRCRCGLCRRTAQRRRYRTAR